MSNESVPLLGEAKELTPQQQKMYDHFCRGRERICDIDSEPESSLSKLAHYQSIKLDTNKISSARNWRTAGVLIYGLFFFILATAIACMPMIPGDQLPYVLLFTTPISVILFALTIYRAFTTTKRDLDYPTTVMGWGFWIAMVCVLINTIVVLAKNAEFVPALTDMLNASLVWPIVGFGVLAIGVGFAFFSFLWSSRQENGVTAKLSQKQELHLMVMLKIYNHMLGVEYNRPWSPITLDSQRIEALIAETRGETTDDKMLAIADKLATFYVDTSRSVTFNLPQDKLVRIITGRAPLQPAMNLNASSSDTSTDTLDTSRSRHPAVVASSASLLGIPQVTNTAPENKL